jgi:hypothetical protein
MSLEKLKVELLDAKEQLKDYNKFIDLMRDKDDPKGILTRLNKTLGRIELLVDASQIKEFEHPKNKALNPYNGSKGNLVSVRPCGEEYGNKTYLGFLIGDLALGSSFELTDDNKIQCNWSGYNPAIFVPELGEIIMGCASWWSNIQSEEDFKKITDGDIDNVWYVQLLQKMNGESKNEDKDEI